MMVRLVLQRENIGEAIHKIGGLGGSMNTTPKFSSLEPKKFIISSAQRTGVSSERVFLLRVVFSDPRGPLVSRLYLPAVSSSPSW